MGTDTENQLAADISLNSRIKRCQRLADIACELDVLKNHFTPEERHKLGLIVISLHDIAISEAGPLAIRVYGEESDLSE